MVYTKATEQQTEVSNVHVKVTNGRSKMSNGHVEKFNGRTEKNVNTESNGHTKDKNLLKLEEKRIKGTNNTNGQEEGSIILTTEDNSEKLRLYESDTSLKKKMTSEPTEGSNEKVNGLNGHKESTNGHEEGLNHSEKREPSESNLTVDKTTDHEEEINENTNGKRKSPEGDIPVKKKLKSASEHTKLSPAQISVKHVQTINQATDSQSFPTILNLLSNTSKSPRKISDEYTNGSSDKRVDMGTQVNSRNKAMMPPPMRLAEEPFCMPDAYANEDQVSNKLFDLLMRVNGLQFPPMDLSIFDDTAQLGFVERAQAQQRIELTDLLKRIDEKIDSDEADSNRIKHSNGQSQENKENMFHSGLGLQPSIARVKQVETKSSFELYRDKFERIFVLLLTPSNRKMSTEDEEKLCDMLRMSKNCDEEAYHKINTFIESVFVSSGLDDDDLDQIEADMECESMKHPPPLTHFGPDATGESANSNNIQRPWTMCPVDLNRPGTSREFADPENYKKPPQSRIFPTPAIPEPILRFDRHFKNIGQKLEQLIVMKDDDNDVLPLTKNLQTINTVAGLKLFKAHIYEELRFVDPFYPSSDSSGDLSE